MCDADVFRQMKTLTLSGYRACTKIEMIEQCGRINYCDGIFPEEE